MPPAILRRPIANLSPRFVVVVICLALFGGSVILYAPSIGFGFVGFDDVAILLDHPNLYAQGSIWHSLHEIFVGYFPREEPLLIRDVSWMLEARLFGFTNPVGYHLGNILLHGANAVLVFLFLLHATRKLGFAALTAALFATLAVHVEPVCWIMGRKDLLGAFFILLALLAQSAQMRLKNRRLRRLLAAVVLLLYPLAVLSKFSAIILVVVLAAHRIFAPYLDGQRSPAESFSVATWPRRLAGLLPHFAIGIGLHFWYQRVLSAFQIIGGFGPSPLSLAHLKNLAILIPLSVQASLFRILWAAQHSLDYLRPSVAIRSTPGEVVVAVGTMTGLLALTGVLLRWRKDLAFFPVTFLLFLLPYFNVVYVGIWAADRYSYLASIAVVALLAAPVVSAWHGASVLRRRAAAVGFAALVTMGGYQVVAGHGHQPAFRSRESLWTYEKDLSPPPISAFTNYASFRLAQAQRAESGSPRQREQLEDAVAAAKQGIRYYATIPWKPAPGYVARERIQLASLFTILGDAATLTGASLEQQLELRRAAFKIAPADTQTYELSRVLLLLALREPRDLARARESLQIFRDHVRYASRDRLLHPELRAQLRVYEESFPELADEVDAIVAQSLPPPE